MHEMNMNMHEMQYEWNLNLNLSACNWLMILLIFYWCRDKVINYKIEKKIRRKNE